LRAESQQTIESGNVGITAKAAIGQCSNNPQKGYCIYYDEILGDFLVSKETEIGCSAARAFLTIRF